MIPRSVTGLSGSDLRRLAGLSDRSPDVVFGGAPCQGFSMIGHRALDDPRNALVREMARLHGFPDWFRFHETKWHGARQVGNSVPPPLARAIAAQIVTALGNKPSLPQSIIRLGDPALLQMDMSEAARYWGIEVPIGRRDRKSGMRKRKQEEIEAINVRS